MLDLGIFPCKKPEFFSFCSKSRPVVSSVLVQNIMPGGIG